MRNHLPLIELRIEVSLFDTSFSFGAFVLVRLEAEGHVGIGAVFGAGWQLSTQEEAQHLHRAGVIRVMCGKRNTCVSGACAEMHQFSPS